MFAFPISILVLDYWATNNDECCYLYVLGNFTLNDRGFLNPFRSKTTYAFYISIPRKLTVCTFDII